MKGIESTGCIRDFCLAGLVLGICLLLPTTVISINALLFTGWTLLQLRSFFPARRSGRNNHHDVPLSDIDIQNSKGRADFVSVHLAIHNEPPSVVRDTLDALARMDCSSFEVIVMDNNTSDDILWRPVEEHCSRLGSRFRFVHRMNVRGAKAGALEITRSLMDVRTTHVAVVDADYQVEPDFISQALTALNESGAHFVQFPQAYRNVEMEQMRVQQELGDYFDRHAMAADSRGDMLLTGTLCVIDADALQRVGGWPCSTITEDAELAMALQRCSLRGVFVPRIAGRGLLPPDACELANQRHRWIVGNIHTLMRAFVQCAQDRRAFVSIDHCAQLTAWCSFTTLPLVIILSGVALVLSGMGESGLWHRASLIASATILGQLFVTVCLSRVSPDFFLVRWILALTSGNSTLFALMMRRIRFRCTQRSSCRGAHIPPDRILLSVLLIISAAAAMYLSWLCASAVLFLCGITHAAFCWLDQVMQARETRSFSTQIINKG